MEEIIKDILNRRGALHIIDGNRFYTEESVKDALKEVLRQLPVSGSFIGCSGCLRPDNCKINGCGRNGSDSGYQ
jgi:hypothetical protein